MSFSSKVKSEICRYVDISKEEAVALLSGIMKVSGTISLGANQRISFKVTTENPTIARLIFKLLKNYFDIHAKIMVKRNNSLKKNNVYVILIQSESGIKDFLREVRVLQNTEMFALDFTIPDEIIETLECKKAYIRGSFLGGGSISNPEKTYHSEFVTHDEEYARELSKLVNTFGVNSKVIKRKSSYVIYVKEGEQICDLLNIIGAFNSLFYFQNVRIMKEMRNNVNRLVNCETANIGKTVKAAVRQIESIKLIEKEIGLKRLAPNLREVALLRLKYPEESLKGLGEMLNPKVGKSGVNHRLRKIEKIAKELRKEGR